MDTQKYRLIYFKTIIEERGDLTVMEFPEDIGFDVKRIFYIYGNNELARRAGHSHKNCKQVIVSLRGTAILSVDGNRVVLDWPDKGLFIDNGVFLDITMRDRNGVLLVLASEHFDKEDYINDSEIS